MKNVTPQIVLARILVLTLTVAAFGRQAAKDPFTAPAIVQNVLAYEAREEIMKIRLPALVGLAIDQFLNS
jgi:hypothetical protein